MALSVVTNDDHHFTLSNIPFGIVSIESDPKRKRIATRLLGDVFLIEDLIEHDLLKGLDDVTREALQQPNLNAFAALPRTVHKHVRLLLQGLLTSTDRPRLEQCRIPATHAIMHLPVHVGDFTDFSCSQNHVLNASQAMTGTRSMPPGFLHFPVGYSGRCSSMLPSGGAIKRPLGQYRGLDGGIVFGPSQQIDYELEIGVVVGHPSIQGEPVPLSSADKHVFGLVLLNDWSARDIQGFEMMPLGPLNGKSFGTSVSPWIITLDALEPFVCKPPAHDSSVIMAEYLQGVDNVKHYTIQLQADLLPVSNCARTSDDGGPSVRAASPAYTVCRSQFDSLYWPVSSLVAHQTINGCPISAGDILGTGTISGSVAGSYGCLLEATEGGKKAITLGNGENRVYLEDGDGIRLTAWAGELGTGHCVGFGSCVGWIEPAIELGPGHA